MSIGYDKIKIGVERDGKRKYLSEVQFGEGEVSYQLSEQRENAKIWDNPEGYDIAKKLSVLEPHETFFILNGAE